MARYNDEKSLRTTGGKVKMEEKNKHSQSRTFFCQPYICKISHILQSTIYICLQIICEKFFKNTLTQLLNYVKNGIFL